MDIFWGTLAIWLGVAAWLLTKRELDRRSLAEFVSTAGDEEPDQRAALFRIATRIFDLPYSADPIWISKLLRPLGATPGAVIAAGGCCSGKARLLILSLAELGIHAHQITLYHRKGHAQHCLVEAQIGQEQLVVDPSYGIYLTDDQGRTVSLRDLQRGTRPVQAPLSPGRQCGYPDNQYHAFDYAASKTANWTRSVARRAAYTLLHKLSRGAVDRMIVPAWLEWPHNIALMAGTMFLSGFAVLAMVSRMA